MILVDNFRVILLVALICSGGIVPSDAQDLAAAKCKKWDSRSGVVSDETCAQNQLCKLGGNDDGPEGCMTGSSACDVKSPNAEHKCGASSFKECCCNTDYCNDVTVAANKQWICTELPKTPGCERKCYVGSDAGGGDPHGVAKACKKENCFFELEKKTGVSKTGCDNDVQKKCKDITIPSSGELTCVDGNSDTGNKVCCCNTDECNNFNNGIHNKKDSTLCTNIQGFKGCDGSKSVRVNKCYKGTGKGNVEDCAVGGGQAYACYFEKDGGDGKTGCDTMNDKCNIFSNMATSATGDLVCSQDICCCNIDDCNNFDTNKNKVCDEFGNKFEGCGDNGQQNGGAPPGDKNLASGLFQNYYGGFPIVSLVVAAIQHFQMTSF